MLDIQMTDGKMIQPNPDLLLFQYFFNNELFLLIKRAHTLFTFWITRKLSKIKFSKVSH